jgi:general secretion pathway protein D
MVECLIVTLTDNQSFDLAVELSKIVTSGDSIGRLTSVFGEGLPDPSSSSLPNIAGPGLEGVVLDPGSFSALVRALEVLNRGRTLTIPKVLVNNHQTATLDSLLQTPFVSTNASQTVATTSFGGTLDAGTSVSVRPQITEGDRLLLDYEVSLSSFVGEASDPVLPPPRQETKLKSVATVPDGFTVVLGGIEIETKTKGTERVPLLGAIPLLGQLFRSDSETANKSRFFVFLRCSVLRAPQFEDLRYVSEQDGAVAGIDPDWPVVEPRVIR